MDKKKALVAGWFSFEQGHATAGDLLVRDLTCEWLGCAGYHYDIALAFPFQGGVDWRSLDPEQYSYVVFVCGPFGKGELETAFLNRFAGCRLVGLNLSMLEPLDSWNPFDLLIERDSSTDAHPDMAFLTNQGQVPVVGVCLVEPYPGGLTEIADAAIWRLTSSREMSVVSIDTRLDTNSTGLRNPVEIETLIARMDIIVTTRLHGTVLALKNGIPAIAIDPEPGGAKIRRQMETIGWPVIFNVDGLTDEALQKAFNYCLTEAGRAKARECRKRAEAGVREIREEFISALTHLQVLDTKYLARTSAFITSGFNSKGLGTDTEVYIPSKRNVQGEVLGKGNGLLKRLAWRTVPTYLRRWLQAQWPKQ